MQYINKQNSLPVGEPVPFFAGRGGGLSEEPLVAGGLVFLAGKAGGVSIPLSRLIPVVPATKYQQKMYLLM